MIQSKKLMTINLQTISKIKIVMKNLDIEEHRINIK